MTLDISTPFAQPRALRVTSRGLRLAVLAIGMPVVAVGAMHTINIERRALANAHAQPSLRGQLSRIGDNPISPVALAAPPGGLPMGAAPFVLKARSSAERSRAVQCLANAIYYEAALEPLDGRRAVAQVVLNRVRNVNFPHSICGVVYQGWDRATGCQFSFTCDGSLLRAPDPALMAEARDVAVRALNGAVMPNVGTATHYHATYVDPWWRSTVVKVAQEGTQIFYRWPGAAGLADAFSQAYGGGELKLSQAVIDGRAPRPLVAAAQLAAALGRAGGLTGAADMPVAPTADGTHRVHVVSYMPAARPIATPAEVAQINASLARFVPVTPPAADKPVAAPTAPGPPTPGS